MSMNMCLPGFYINMDILRGSCVIMKIDAHVSVPSLKRKYKYSTNIPYITDIFKYGYTLDSRGSYVRQHIEGACRQITGFDHTALGII